MSLITIGRSLVSQDQENEDGVDKDDEVAVSSESCSKSSHSEDFFMCKTSAITLNVKSQRRTSVVKTTDNLHEHLKKILSILRFEDYIKLIVKLENPAPRPFWHRYLAIISTVGTLGSEESIILGVDVHIGEVTVGLVLPILQDMVIKLDGDGGFKLVTKTAVYLFKPISVQALWAAHQAIMIACRVAQTRAYHTRGLSHTWLTYYSSLASSDPQKLYEWNKMEDIEDMGRATPQPVELNDSVDDDEKRTQILQANIRTRLQMLMSSVDLEDVTVLQLREMLEKEMGISLKEQRQFIADQVLLIYGQMDAASVIFDHLLLGSSFNASNGAELLNNNVTHIINVTREVDNFFPSSRFTYKNVRVFDDEKADLLTHWEDTHRFINEARANGTRCLVHCKMGISRSGATVVAYVMKEKGWDLKKSLDYVRSKRPCVNPNPNFLRQLETYQGILEASSNRHKPIFQNCTPATTPEMGIKFTANPALRTSARFEAAAAACLPGPASLSGEALDLLREYNTDLGPNPPNSVDLEAELFAYKTAPNQPPAAPTKDRTVAASTQEPSVGLTAADTVQSTQTSGPIPIVVEPSTSKCTVLATTSQCLRHWHPDLYEDLAPPPSLFLSPNIPNTSIGRSKSSPTYSSLYKRVAVSQSDSSHQGSQQHQQQQRGSGDTNLSTAVSTSMISAVTVCPPREQTSVSVPSGPQASYRSSCGSFSPVDIFIPPPDREHTVAAAVEFSVSPRDGGGSGGGPSPTSSRGSSISEHDFVLTVSPPSVDATVEASKSVPTLRCSRSGGCREAEPVQEEQSSPNCAPSSSLPHQPLRPPVELQVPKPQPLSCADDLSPEDYLHRKRLSCRSVPETMESGSSSLVQAAGAETVSGACNRSTSLILRVRPDDSWIHKAPPPGEDEPPRATVPVLHPIADLPLRMQEDNPPSHELSRPVRRVVSSMEPVFLRRRSPASVVRQPQSVPLLADS